MSSIQDPGSTRQIPLTSDANLAMSPGVSTVNTGGHLEPTIVAVDSGEVAPAEEIEAVDSGEVAPAEEIVAVDSGEVAPAEESDVGVHDLEGHARRHMSRCERIAAIRLETALSTFRDQPHILALLQDSNAVSDDEKSETELSAKDNPLKVIAE
ncbi:hypothetical protein MJO28_003088 [Puccinia striiformis f. sp. tritici]|uniref:Uncharacterized protein n=1 Tax=Puccinia striiformis f. sp. tritici TaxID=168172 RepID=A0ACC0ES62_9BASI|nr:hypothetical protein MJO28_003088 [Puccinia striiformis f. sp. tritici]